MIELFSHAYLFSYKEEEARRAEIQRSDSDKMPCLYISTNVNLDDVDKDPIFSEATKAVASIIGRPEHVNTLYPFNSLFLQFLLLVHVRILWPTKACLVPFDMVAYSPVCVLIFFNGDP